MQTILVGQTQTDKVSNKTVSGVMLWFNGVNAATNTPYAANPLVLNSITMKVILKRGGRDFILFNGTLRNAVAFSALNNNMWQMFGGGIVGGANTLGQLNCARTLVLAALGVAEIRLVPLPFYFGGVINLKGDDSIETEVSFPNGAMTAANSTANSFLMLDCIEGVGVEKYVPYTMSDTIQANVQNYSQAAFGDNVTKIAYLNYDTFSYLTASQIVTNLQLQSEWYKRNDNALEIQAKNLAFQPYVPYNTAWPGTPAQATNAFEKWQCIDIYEGLELKNAGLDLTLTQSLVTATNNVVMWRRNYTDQWLLERAAAMEQKHVDNFVASVKKN